MTRIAEDDIVVTHGGCPDAARWNQHLEGSLPAEEQAELIRHLDSCGSCQRLLESLAAGGESLLIMARQVGHMSRLIDDLLDVSRLLRGRVELRRERLDLGRLARTALADQRPALDRAGLALAGLREPDLPDHRVRAGEHRAWP